MSSPMLLMQYLPTAVTQPFFEATLHADVVRIVDQDDGIHRSVTNAAEMAVASVLACWPQVAARRLPIVYRDSAGRWDQLEHDGHRFTGFRSLNANSEDEAVTGAWLRA